VYVVRPPPPLGAAIHFPGGTSSMSSRATDRRFPLLTDATMTPRQRESYQKIVSCPPKGASGPLTPLLRRPEAGDTPFRLAARRPRGGRSDPDGGRLRPLPEQHPARAQRVGDPDRRPLLER